MAALLICYIYKVAEKLEFYQSLNAPTTHVLLKKTKSHIQPKPRHN